MYQLPQTLVKELLLALENDATLFPSTIHVNLYSNNLTPGPGNVVADFTPITNTQVPGYASGTFSWEGTPILSPTGVWEDRSAAPIDFVATSNPSAPQICYGWFAADSSGLILKGSGIFPTPFTFTQAGNGIRLHPIIQVSQVDGENYNVSLDMPPE